MTYEKIDIDCFNDEQAVEQSYDCLEYGQHLMETGKIDLSDQLYEQYREEQAEKEEKAEDAYREKMELEFNQN